LFNDAPPSSPPNDGGASSNTFPYRRAVKDGTPEQSIGLRRLITLRTFVTRCITLATAQRALFNDAPPSSPRNDGGASSNTFPYRRAVKEIRSEESIGLRRLITLRTFVTRCITLATAQRALFNDAPPSSQRNDGGASSNTFPYRGAVKDGSPGSALTCPASRSATRG
jgi:hypothetical protein